MVSPEPMEYGVPGTHAALLLSKPGGSCVWCPRNSAKSKMAYRSWRRGSVGPPGALPDLGRQAEPRQVIVRSNLNNSTGKGNVKECDS